MTEAELHSERRPYMSVVMQIIRRTAEVTSKTSEFCNWRATEGARKQRYSRKAREEEEEG